tara:strand:- start:13 stop:282 length:270 start_codon:yes stop_codon:yes gene_type:complete
MGEVLSFGIQEADEHLKGPAKCLTCTHEWLAVTPVGTVEIECPECETKKGVYIGTAAPDTAWECGCGNQLFYIGTEGAMCARCGTEQVF